jgi:hypothetical protein
MKVIYILLFIFIFPNVTFCSDLSMLAQYNAGYWITRSSNNKLTVIGVSNPMLRRQDEITSAKEDAARKVAMYFGIHGNIETTNRTGTGFFDFSHDSNIEMIYDANHEKFLEQLTFDPQNDVLRTSEAIFIRFQYETAVTSINYNSANIDVRPDWTRNQNKPELDGYVTVVGFSRNQRRLKDTIYRATEDAIIRMIEDLSTIINTKEISIAEQGASSVIHARSEGRLNNFRVIEFWIDPETRFVYTLAIARAGE